MELIINLESPLRTVITKILSEPPEKYKTLGRSQDNDMFFQLLISLGCDYFQLLQLFIEQNGIYKGTIESIIECLPNPHILKRVSVYEVKKIISHWTPSRYHTDSIDNIIIDITNHLLETTEEGVYIYNSNLNNRKKAHNDLYLLIITNNKKLFFDINLRKVYLFCLD